MRQSLYKLFINFFWNNLFTKNNMRKLLVIFFGLSAICFSAKLNYTNKSTTSYKGEIIKYAENTEEDYPIFNMLYDSESGMSTPSYWKEALDIDISSIKVMRVPGMRKENKRYSSTSHHMISMFKSFDMSMGGNYVKNNLDSVVMTTGVIPGKMPRGIISLSTYAHAGSSGFLGSHSFFFGDVINELSGGFHQSPRLIGVTSDNTNLYIGTFGNGSTIESENRMSGDDIPVIHPSQETFYFPMFGEEVQKMSRSDNIRVKDFTCGNMFHSSKRLPDIRGIEGDSIYLKKVLIKLDRIDDLKEIVATNPNNVVESYEANRKENSIYDVNVNPRKYQDLKREYFMSDFKSSIIKKEADTEILNKMRKRYLSLSEAPEEYLEIVPGYSNGNFKFDNAEDNEFLKYNNPISSNDMFELLNNDLIWTNYYDARKAAGL